MAQSRPSVWRGPTGVALLGMLASLLAGWIGTAQSAGASQITEFAVPAGGFPNSITAGPEGNLWFTAGPSQIGRITPAGEITEFPTSAASNSAITTGPDGNLWSCGGAIGRTTPSGVFSAFRSFDSSEGCLEIAPGPEGDIWMTHYEQGLFRTYPSYIWRVTPEGQFSTVELPKRGQEPNGLTLGPEGDLWITEKGGWDQVKLGNIDPAKVLRMTPQGQFTEFTLPKHDAYPGAITMGPAGNLWFVEWDSRIGRVTPDGEFEEFPLPRKDLPLWDLTVGPDGNIWFVGGENVGLITPSGAVTQYPEEVNATSIAAGPEGDLWFTEPHAGVIGRITPGTVGIGFEGSAIVHKGKVRLTLLCGGGTPGERCAGKVSVRLKQPTADRPTRGQAATKRLIASGKYSASSGTPKVVFLKLSAQARRIFKHRKELSVVASATLAGGSAASKPLVLVSK